MSLACQTWTTTHPAQRGVVHQGYHGVAAAFWHGAHSPEIREVAPSQRRRWRARTLQWQHSRQQWWAKPAVTAKCQRRRWARMPSQPGTHGGRGLRGLSASNPILQDPEGNDSIGRDLTSPSYVPIPWKVDAIPIPNSNSIQTSDIRKTQFQFPIS